LSTRQSKKNTIHRFTLDHPRATVQIIPMHIKNASERYIVKPGSKVKLNKIDTTDKSLYEGGKEHHHDELHELREELREMQNLLYAEGKQKLLVVIQAMDTGGKDGCVKTVFGRVDPQGIQVHPFKKPSDEELAHDFLWRIHQHVPANGMISVFNRSHYEDIIAVKVKKILPESIWSNRYRHIVEFERMLAEEGTKIVKIFLHISKDEQKERLQARLDDPGKHWKFNPEDLKDRAKWDYFMKEYENVLEKTSTDEAPWFIIPADRKWYRNLVVSQIIIDALKSLNMNYPEIGWDPSKMKI
jgi:PPK2 family polyphosphate:nucleotide phosphotransferase